MSEWISPDDDFERLLKQASTDPRMALEVARAAWRRSLNAGLDDQQAYNAVIQAMRDVVPDPGLYADHVSQERLRMASIIREGIYHKGALVFIAAEIADLAERKRQQIYNRPDMKKMEDAVAVPTWAAYQEQSPEGAERYRQNWMAQHGDDIRHWSKDLRYQETQYHPDISEQELLPRLEEQLRDIINQTVDYTWNQAMRERNAEITKQRAVPQMIRRVLDELPDEAFKLFDFVAREIKRGRFLPPDAQGYDGIRQGIDRQVKMISDAALILNELAKRNKPFPNFTAKDFTMDDLEKWMYADKDNAKLLRSLKADDFEIGPGYDADYDRVVYEFPDGWSIRELPSDTDEVELEGTEMQHCLQHCDEYYWDHKIRDGYSRIFSLRDPLNYPHATVEFAASRGMPSHDGTWYINQGYAKQDMPISNFPEYERRINEWYAALKRDKNITVQHGSHYEEYRDPDREDDEWEEREPEHLTDYDEGHDPDNVTISDSYDLEQYFASIHSSDSQWDSDDPYEGEHHNDDNGDYWYTYELGATPELYDPESIAEEIFERLGGSDQFSESEMDWGYYMMEAMVYAFYHERASYGTPSPYDKQSLVGEVQQAASAVLADVRSVPPTNGQLGFEEEDPSGEPNEWTPEEPEEFHGITPDGGEMVKAALYYFQQIINKNLYSAGALPDKYDTHNNLDPDAAFKEFADQKTLPEGGAEKPELTPGQTYRLPSGLEETGRDPDRWKDELYEEWKQKRDMQPGVDRLNDALDGAPGIIPGRVGDPVPAGGMLDPDGSIDDPNIQGIGEHPAHHTPDTDLRYPNSEMGWTPNGYVFVRGGERGPEWRPMGLAAYNLWGEGMRAQMGGIEPQPHPDTEAYWQRNSHVVEAADVGELAAKAFQSLISRADYVKADANLADLTDMLEEYDPDSKEHKELVDRIESHPIKTAMVMWRTLMRNENIYTYKLWPWVWREIKKGNIYVAAPQDHGGWADNTRHALDIIKQGAEMLNDMRQHNRLPRGFDINQLSFDEFEDWIRDNQPDHSDEWQDSETVHSFKNGWTIAKVGPNDCVREGELMGHCVGGYGDDVENGRTEIYSLRDPKGMPHVTLEMTPPKPAMREGQRNFEGTAQAILQVQGKSNHRPIPAYEKHLEDWFNENNRTSDNKFVWEGWGMGGGESEWEVNDAKDLSDWWRSFKDRPEFWLEGTGQDGGVMITTEQGEYGLPMGWVNEGGSNGIYVRDWDQLEEDILHTLVSQEQWWRGDGNDDEMARALYYLCHAAGVPFTDVLEKMQEQADEWSHDYIDQNWSYIREEINEALEREFGDRVDMTLETLDGYPDKYEEEFEALREQVEQQSMEYAYADAWKFLTYCYHLEGLYPTHKTEDRGPAVYPRHRNIPPEGDIPLPDHMLKPWDAEKEVKLREMQPSLPDVQPSMLHNRPEQAPEVPDEIAHMEEQRAIDMYPRQPNPNARFHSGDPRRNPQQPLASLDAALTALASPMQASTLDWTIERHPTAQGFWRIANMKLAQDGRAYDRDEDPTDGFLTHVVANRDLLLDGYAVTDRNGELALLPLQ